MKASQWAQRMPWSIVIAYGLLSVIGLTCIARGEQWIATGGYYWRRQLVWVVVSALAMLLATLPNYRILARWSYGIYLLSIPLLLLVFAYSPVNGARRWIRLGALSLQPAEFAKLAYVLALARYLMQRTSYRRIWGMTLPLAMTAVPCLLILKEPDLGMALIFFPVLLLTLFVAGARVPHLIAVACLGLAAAPLLWPRLSAEQRSRITLWLTQSDRGPPPRDHGYQLYHSKVMMSLGGLWGSGWQGDATDDPAAYRLPEARTDFIFSVIGERWGLAGCTATLLLFCLILRRGLLIAAATKESFGRLVAVGLVAFLGTPVVINTAMTVGLLPITGLTLPIVSYGGSSLLATGLALGLLLNVAIRPGYEVTPEPFRFRR